MWRREKWVEYRKRGGNIQNGSHLKIRYRLYNSWGEYYSHYLTEIVLEKNVRCCKPHTREIDQVIQRDILLTLIKIFEVCERLYKVVSELLHNSKN